jgi:transcription elongation GreA/GreB family factor
LVGAVIEAEGVDNGEATFWAERAVIKQLIATKKPTTVRLKKGKVLRIGHQDSGEKRARKTVSCQEVRIP